MTPGKKTFCCYLVKVWPDYHILLLVVAFSPACAHGYPYQHGKACIFIKETAVSNLISVVPDGDSYGLAPRYETLCESPNSPDARAN
jgi:hypothetical protein